MMENAFCTKNVVLALDLKKQCRLIQFYQEMLNKSILHQNHGFGTRFREKVITNQVLTQDVAKRIWYQKGHFGIIFSEIVHSKPSISVKTALVLAVSQNLLPKRPFWYKIHFATFCVKTWLVITFTLNLVPKPRFWCKMRLYNSF